MRNEKYRLPVIVALLCLIGGILSVVSLQHYVALKSGLQREPSFCNISAEFNCDLVTASPWATLFGFPLAAYAVAFYLIIFLYALYSQDSKSVTRHAFTGTIFFLATLASLMSLFLFYVSEFRIGTLCLICMGMYLVNFALFVSAWIAKEEGAVEAFLRGVTGILSIPMLAYGGDSQAVHTRVGVLVAFLVMFASYMLPNHILQRLLVAEYSKPKQTIEDLYNAWLSAKEDKIEIVLSGPSQDYVKGEEAAKYKIVEFFDFECPACRAVSPYLDRIFEKYPGKIQVVYKNYPLDKSCNPSLDRAFHEFACSAAFIARCAGEQGKYLEVAEYLLTMPELEKEDKSEVQSSLDQVAIKFSLDQSAFKECLAAERTKNKILEDVSIANALGLEGTPSFWINGRRITAGGLEELATLIEHIVEKGA